MFKIARLIYPENIIINRLLNYTAKRASFSLETSQFLKKIT